MSAATDGVVSANVAMCACAFDVLCTELQLSTVRRVPSSHTADGIPNVDGVGLFVTWNISGKNGRPAWKLRGCIGTLSPTRLRDALPTYAKQSAFHDKRFSPIVAEEVPDLQAVVSVLSGFEVAPGGVFDWTVGLHGIVLTFSVGKGYVHSYSATFLPEVCEEQGWTKEECIECLARKAGFRGQLTAAILETAQLTRYVSTKASLSYIDYMAMKTLN